MRSKQELIDQIDKARILYGFKSRNEFINEACAFYIDYLASPGPKAKRLEELMTLVRKEYQELEELIAKQK